MCLFVTSVFCSVLFFSRPRSEGWLHHGRTFSIYPCPLSFWLTLPRRVLSTSWCCPSIQAVRGLPRLRAPGIAACIISFSGQLPCFLMVWPYYASFLALTVSNSSLFTPAWVVLKRMNRSRCCLGRGLVGSKKQRIMWRPGSPHGKGTFWGVILGHATVDILNIIS